MEEFFVLLEDYNDYKTPSSLVEITKFMEDERKLMITPKNESLFLRSLDLLVGIVIKSDRITTINVNDNDLSIDGGKLVPTFPTISLLALKGNSIGLGCIDVIAEGLKENTSITDLCLSKNNLGDAGAESLAKSLANNSTITFLNLSANQISATGAAALCDALVTMPNLKNVYLHTNSFGSKAGSALAHLVANSTSLQVLDIKSVELENEGAIRLATGLSKTKSLATFDVSGNQIQAAGIDAIALALSGNKSLLTLYMARNDIGNSSMEGFGTLLRDNSTLTFIDLNWNGMGAAGAHTISMNLPANQTLETLDLSKNRLAEAEIKELSESLLFTSLTSFTLQDNDIGNDEAKNYVTRPLNINKICKTVYIGNLVKVLFNNELLPRDISKEGDVFKAILEIQQKDIKRKQIKIAVLGNSGLGKTTFVQSYANFQKSFWEQLKDKILRAVSKNQVKPTLGIDETIYDYNESKFVTWDFSGKDDCLEWIPHFLSEEAVLYLVCYDLSADEATQTSQITKWLDLLSPLISKPGPRKIFLVGMRGDAKSRKKTVLDLSRWTGSFPSLHDKVFAISKSDAKSTSRLWHEVMREGERVSQDILPIPGRFMTLLGTLNSVSRGIVRQEDFHQHGFGEDWSDHVEKGLAYLHSAGDLVWINGIVCTKPILLAKKLASKNLSFADLKSITDIQEGSSSAK